ncbi:13305_t:CDS:1 [Funneliformis geosporum]|uniref:13305_t:CDS:1 n=1 Tax=Funneliformis geosporum TaxID=1117311 RepID=A0A9W4WHS6_9GLOM|nr:13305_t:CDS:1 [Funneliformis geosporum]
MTEISSSSLNDLAEKLYGSLDRKKIFPPLYANPEELINPTNSRSKRPPRPPNGFLLCRKNVHKEARLKGFCNMRVISKVTGMLWRSATPEEKESYEKLSVQVNKLHSQRYPGYKYRPTIRPRLQAIRPYVAPQIIPEALTTLPAQIIHNQQPVAYPMYYPDVVAESFQFPQFTQEELALLSCYLF